MSVRVPASRRHQRNARTQTEDQGRVLVCRPVVRHLEDVDAQAGGLGTQQVLGVRFDVAGEQHPHAGHLGEHHQARVVRHRSGQPAHPGRVVRGEDAEPDPVADDAFLAVLGGQQRDTLGRRPAAHAGGLARRFGHRRGRYRTDRAVPQHTGQALDVIGVVVAEDRQRDPADAEFAQAAVDRPRIRTGVHHHRGPRTRVEDERVALADVAHRQMPAGRRPTGQRPDHGRGPEQHHHEEARHRDECQGPPRHHPHQGDQRERRHREGDAAAETARPADRRAGHARPGARHRGNPRDRPRRHVREQGGCARPHRCHEQHQEPEDGRRDDRELGQQIARHGDQADPVGERHHDRPAHRLRGTRHRDGRRHLDRPAAPRQRPCPVGREEQQRTRGEHRQHEAEAARESGIDEQQDERRPGECRRAVPAPPGEQRRQGDQSHDRGAQHAGIGTGQHDEGEHRPGAEQRESAATDTGVAEGEQCGAEQDRDVRAGDGGEVGEFGGFEVVEEVGRDRPGVPDHQAGEQSAGGRREPGARGAEAFAQVTGPALVGGGVGEDPRLGGADEQERGVGAAVAGGHQPPGDFGPGGGQEAGPGGRGRGEDGEGRAGMCAARRGGPHRDVVGAGPHPHGSPAPRVAPDFRGDGRRVVGHREPDRGGTALRGQPGHRAGTFAGREQSGGTAARCQADQHHGRCGPHRSAPASGEHRGAEQACPHDEPDGSGRHVDGDPCGCPGGERTWHQT